MADGTGCFLLTGIDSVLAIPESLGESFKMTHDDKVRRKVGTWRAMFWQVWMEVLYIVVGLISTTMEHSVHFWRIIQPY